MTRAMHEKWLLELTSLPTASGREDRVIKWVRAWAARRKGLEVRADRYGNLLIKQKGARSVRPIFFTAHMDHPAFVVTSQLDGRTIGAEFRGGVKESFFVGTPVVLFHEGIEPRIGRIIEFDNRPDKDSFGASDGDKKLIVRFDTEVHAALGDVLTWETGPARIEGDRLFAPACDDLAGLAAAVSAYDVLLSERTPRGGKKPDVRLLLTRAEEFGFVGAIAACKAGSIPKAARLVALENSKSYPESPIGQGPIVRVGDYTSTFDPDLTYRIGRVAQQLVAEDSAFKYQRKLMPGGTCEASAYQCYGFVSTCLCLPLGNYHNMNETSGKIESETISLGDYHGLVRLLVAVGKTLDDPSKSPALRNRLDELFERRREVLG